MQTKQTTDRERELVELERAFWDAMKQRDGKLARELTDQTCIVVGASGVGEVDRAAIGTMVEQAKWKLEKFELSPNVHVRMVGDDVAIVAYQVDEKLLVDGKHEVLTAYDSSVWVRKQGRWVCVLHTESLAGDPYGRDRNKQQPRA
jgi:hypothetical protein